MPCNDIASRTLPACNAVRRGAQSRSITILGNFMLCEQCREREATVHLTNVFGQPGEATKHNLCELCYCESGVYTKRICSKPYKVDLWDSFDRSWSGLGPAFDDLNEAKAVCDQMQAKLPQGTRTAESTMA